MGISDRTRATLGTIRAFPTLGRRVFGLEQAIAIKERQAPPAEILPQIAELNHRTLALTHQVEHLYSLLELADPQASLDIATGVRDQVRDLTVELTEQANRTSAVLASLETGSA